MDHLYQHVGPLRSPAGGRSAVEGAVGRPLVLSARLAGGLQPEPQRRIRVFMSDERDDDEKEHPGEQLRQGLGLLWRAARGAAVGVKKEMNRTDLGRSVQDAGRELARAATNVVGRLADEIQRGTQGGPHHPPPRQEPPADDRGDHDNAEAKHGEDESDDEFDGVKAPVKKPTGPTPQDPGFRIMVDDEKKPQ